MCINSSVNICILTIQIFNLMSECQEPFGLFCSRIHKSQAIQYYKIIFSEFFTSMLQLIAHFTYIAFSITRLSLIGDTHGKFVTFISETLAIKYYMLTIAPISLLLAMVKNFRYEVNTFNSDHNYPFEFQNNPFHNPPKWKAIVIIVFNAICDSMIYIVFFFITFVIDVVLVVQLKRTIDAKKAKFQ